MKKTIRLTADSGITSLLRAEDLIVGGGLAGCSAAYLMAKAGRKVALAAQGCSIPIEISEFRRPWITGDDFKKMPADMREVFRQSVSRELNDCAPLLNLSRLSVNLEDLLLDAGVPIYYGMTPCGVERGENDNLASVIFGGKFGLRAIKAANVIDTTPHAIIAELAGNPTDIPAPPDGRITIALSAKAGMASDDSPITADRGQRNECPTDWPDVQEIEVPGCEALVGGRVALRGPYAEFIFRLPFDPSDPFYMSTLSIKARQLMIDVGAEITRRRAESGQRPLFFHRFSGGLLTEPLIRLQSSADTHRHPILENLWICAARKSNIMDGTLRDPYAEARIGADIAGEIIEKKTGEASRPRLSLTAIDASDSEDSGAQFRFCDSPALHADGDDVEIGEFALPVLDECETLVVGGGTSGVPAAIGAAESGADTILIEQHSDLGGVRTIGGVGSYWFGRVTPCLTALDERFDAVSDRSGMAEELSMLRVILDSSVRIITHAPTVGVAVDGDRVIGVVVATGRGLAIILAHTIVDSTGDSDIAAWAGAPFEYGNGRDEWTIWGSFGNFNEIKRTANRQYESAMETRDPHDMARMIIRGRRRQGMWSKLPHEMPQLYATPRESRRLAGRARVTYRGILAGETFPDVMVVCKSNFDIKGIATSDALCSGIIWSWNFLTNYFEALPYRAVLPIGLENLIVAGRAYSASHDAMTLGRMQRDMVSMGYAAGVAAAMAAKNDLPPGALDIAALQYEWVRRGALLREDLRRWSKPPRVFTVEDAEREARGLLSGNGKYQIRLARLVGSKNSIEPLRRAFKEADEGALKIKIARALCILGDSTGAPFLLESIAKQIADGLPHPRKKTLAIPPEHGYAPEPVYSLYALALAGEGKRATNILSKIAEQIPDDESAFGEKTESPFEYVRVICAVAERCPGAEMIPSLDILLDKRCLNNLSIPYYGDMRLTLDPVKERLAYLELCVGRALARCADRRGFEILIGYTDDARGVFAASAISELRELLGDTSIRGQEGWRELFSAKEAEISPRPFARRID